MEMGTNSAYEYHEAKINNQPCKVCFDRVLALSLSGLIVALINLFPRKPCPLLGYNRYL